MSFDFYIAAIGYRLVPSKDINTSDSISVDDFCEYPMKSVDYQYAISDSGKQMIKKFEGLILTKDEGNQIGYGHKILKHEDFENIDESVADSLFDIDIEKVNTAVNRLIKELPYSYEFNQGFIDGLVSMVYNCGENGVRTSDFYERLSKCRVYFGEMNEEDYNFTLSAVKTTRAPLRGHKIRRKKEYKVMMYGYNS